MDKSTNWYVTKLPGEYAEKKAEEFCKENNLFYQKATVEDQGKGIDFYYGENKIPVDCKNSLDLYACNITGTIKPFRVRHPFRYNCEAKELWVFNSYQDEWAYKGNIVDYLVEHFFTSETTLQMARNFLYDEEMRYINSSSVIESSLFLFKIKSGLLPLVKASTYVGIDQQGDSFLLKLRCKKWMQYENTIAGAKKTYRRP